MLADLTAVGVALAAPARAAMVGALLDGQEHTAGQLRRVAGVAASTASGHLATLVASGLVTWRREGRSRLFRLAGADVAQALEALTPEPLPSPPTSLRHTREQRRVRAARTCYDHLAGEFGVRFTEALGQMGWFDATGSTLTHEGRVGAERLGLDLHAVFEGRRPVLRMCLDWTERRSHVAGAFGAVLAAYALDQRWVLRREGSRGLSVTDLGRRRLEELELSATQPPERSEERTGRAPVSPL